MELPWSSYTAAPMPCLIDGVYHDASEFKQQPNATTDAFFETWGVLPGNASRAAHLPKECVFRYLNTLGAQEFLPGFLAGSVWYAPEADESGPALYNAGDTGLALVARVWDSMADGMTANMRRNGDASNSEPARGVAKRTATCVSVRWPWLAYPAALLALTAVFLAATVVESVGRSSGFHVWKGNPLALLFHGLDGEEVAKYRGEVTHEGQMEQVAKKVRVRMGDLGSGMQLVEVSAH
ncbi:hypothetical protein SLS58_001242 [Diplodia intermedia]|uniref:Uncharacterized protein n=1 Tax=Diplodia intermedia TaxID=856260 RepID=A0ABR3U2W5_9PEZI